MVAVSQVFTVTAERADGWWVLEAPDVGAVSQVRHLSQARSEMAEALAWLAGVDESEVEICIEVIPPAGVAEHLAASRQASEEAERLRGVASTESAAAARMLHDSGVSLRDAGEVMGISHQRVAQLLA